MSGSDEAWPSHPRWCVPYPRCRICQFDLVKGDQICFALDPVAKEVSCAFEFEAMGQKCFDESRCIQFHLLFNPRQCDVCDEGSSTFCLHSHCRSQLFFHATSSFFAATSYAYMPPQAEKRRRSLYLHNNLASKLCRSIMGPPLPPEIWHMVAGHLTRECAAVTAQEQDRAVLKTGDHAIDLRRPVLASVIKIEGNLYLGDLYNDEPEKETETPRFRLLPGHEALKSAKMDMYIAQDHLGVRKVVFLTSKRRDAWCRKQALVPGVWWRRIPRVETCANLQIQTDGLKVREILNASEPAPRDPLSELLWRAPLPSPPDVVSLLTLDVPNEYLHRRRMDFFECNHPDAVGYLVACSGYAVYRVAAHKRGERPGANLYEGLRDRYPHWMYMPVDEGEYITHISRRLVAWNNYNIVEMSLMFTTNKGRNAVFGDHPKTSDVVLTVPRSQSRVHFNWWDNPDGQARVDYMAIEPTSQPELDPPLEAPKLPVHLGKKLPSRVGGAAWTLTSCSLQGVSEIQPCIRHSHDPHPLVVGMLVCYTSGHRECVGQFRPDCAVEPISTLGKDTLFIQYATLFRRRAAITAITPLAPCETDGIGWKAIPMDGVLEWWFSSGCLVLYQDGKRIEVPEELDVSEP